MRTYSLAHVSDQVLLRDLAALVSRERSTTALLLAHIAEVDARKLYVPAAYPSMFHYCVGELRLSEDSAFKRIRAARAAREYPAILDAVADGRLHLSAVVLLTPHLTPETAGELLAAAEHKSKSEIERLLASRYQQPELTVSIESSPALPATVPVGESLAPGPVAPIASGPPAPVKASSAEGITLKITIDVETHKRLEYARELLGQQVPSGNVGQVFGRALEALIRQLEKRKFAATDRPAHPRPTSSNPRHVAAHVKRAVWKRDGGRCTFVSDTGRRCEARTDIEYDHLDPVARGGRATIDRMRLRCRAHNQYEAERAFGREFMNHKRTSALAKRRERRVLDEPDKNQDVAQALRTLGFRAEEIRIGTLHCRDMADASLECRVRAALAALTPAHRHGKPVALDRERLETSRERASSMAS